MGRARPSEPAACCFITEDRHLDHVRVRDNMVVRQDVAFSADDEPRPKASLETASWLSWWKSEESAEQIVAFLR